jgi:hypothetical protein
MKKYLLLFSVLVSTYTSFAQDSGITYQAVIYKPGGEQLPGQNNMSAPLANANICLQFSIIDSDKNTAYQEVVKTKTDDFGMVNLVIGTHGQSGGYAAGFNGVAWDNLNNNLRIAIDVKGGCSQFEQISDQALTYVPMALYARKAESILGIVPIENGGTGASTTASAKAKLGLELVDNTSDLNKPVSTATQTALDTKVAISGQAFTGTISATNLSGTNTGDQDLTFFVTNANLDLKADIASPTFTGTPTLPAGTIAVTQTAGDNSTAVATTAYIDGATTAINTLADGKIYLGNALNVATEVAINGDVTIDNAGVSTIGAIKVTNAMLAGSIDLTSKVTSTLPIANGGTGAATLTANNVLLGNGTSAVQTVAPGTTGNVLTSNGTTWTSAVASGGGGGAHTIGESYGGGIVFWVTTDGLHGLIAETIDQSMSSNWYDAQNFISQNSTHSTAGKLYTDWRLPTTNELNLLYLQRITVGDFASAFYWSSSENDNDFAWTQYFAVGSQGGVNKNVPNYVRAVRAF